MDKVSYPNPGILKLFLLIYVHSHKWYPEVTHFCPTTPLILVGLKSDLRNNRNATELLRTQGLTPVTQQQGQTVAQRMGARYVECSSKTMTGVEDVFDLAVNMAVGGADYGSPIDRLKKKKAPRCRIL